MLKKILIALAVLGVGAFAAYKFVKKSVPDLTDVKAVVSSSFASLNEKMVNNDTSALQKMTGQVVAIAGTVMEVSSEKTNTDSLIVNKEQHDCKTSSGLLVTVTLGDTTTSNTVVCQADARHISDFSNLKTGAAINIKGMCNGYASDDMGLGGTLQLKNCVLAK